MTSIKKNHIVNCINYANENKLFDRLNNIYKELPSGDCSGCGNCCMESVGINLIEFINIYKFLQDKPELKNICLDKIIDYYSKLRKGKASAAKAIENELKKISAPTTKTVNLSEFVTDCYSNNRKECELMIVEGVCSR